MTPRLDPDGAEHHPDMLDPAELECMDALSHRLRASSAGLRLSGDADVARLTASTSTIGRLAAEILGTDAQPVRAILFDKTAQNNWPLGWHQDRTICVRERADVPGFGPFTVKNGLLHVQPPAQILARMLTMRVHLDPCPETNAPLKVALGSHNQGFVPTDLIADVVAKSHQFRCLAERGDIWVYRTLIVHASDRAQKPLRRRILQLDFSADPLPSPLQWAGL